MEFYSGKEDMAPGRRHAQLQNGCEERVYSIESLGNVLSCLLVSTNRI
jgi:hypothetical protein